MLSFIERRNLSVDAQLLRQHLLGVSNRSGVPVNDTTGLNHSAVWGAINFVASTLAMLPLRLQRPDADGNPVRVDGPVAELGRRPNSRMTAFRWIQLQTAQAIWYGNGYATIERTRSGMPIAVWPLPPATTKPRLNERGMLVYDVRHRDGRTQTIDGDNVIHIHGFGLDEFEGTPFWRIAGEAIGIGLAAQAFGAEFFGGGANPRMIVSHPGQLGDEVLPRMRRQLNDVMGGLGGAHKVAILEEGMTAQALTIAPEAAQFLETRKDNRVEIASMLCVPPNIIGVYDRATYANAEQMDIFVAKYTMSSWVRRWEDELRYKLVDSTLRGAGASWHINMNALVRGDIRTRSEFYKVMAQGLMTPNEIRAKEDLPSLPGFDEPFVPLNMGGIAEEQDDG